jgi:hypothetical protein
LCRPWEYSRPCGDSRRLRRHRQDAQVKLCSCSHRKGILEPVFTRCNVLDLMSCLALQAKFIPAI